MATGDVHTVHRDGVWINEVDGARVGGVYPTERDAVIGGRELAVLNRSQHFIHDLGGEVRVGSTDGSIPRDIPG